MLTSLMEKASEKAIAILKKPIFLVSPKDFPAEFTKEITAAAAVMK